MSNDNNTATFNGAGDSLITAEAASWLAQTDSGTMSAQDKLALAEWISRSPKHQQEIRRLEAIWGDIDTTVDRVLTPTKPSSLVGVVSAWTKLRPIPAMFGSIIVASGLVMMVGLLTFTGNQSATSAEQSFTYKATQGQTRVIPLSDGSVVHLNSNAIAEIRYSEQDRRVRLISGEALFDVAKDPSRPFRVYAGNARAQAVGTSFMVKLINTELELVVTQGQVALDNTSFEEAIDAPTNFVKPNLQTVLVNNGQRVVSNQMHTIQTLDEQSIARHSAWVDGKHIFEGETLKYVVQEISRHSTKKIVVADPSLGELRVGGVFELGKVELFLSTLTESFDVSVKRVDENLIYIEPRAR